MKPTRTLLRLSLSVSLLLGSALLASALAHPTVAARPNDAIEQAMGQLQQSMKALGKGINADNQTAALEELAKMEQAILSAKVEVPDTAGAVDEKKRPEFVAGFRSAQLELLKHICDVEIAVVNGKYKDAEGILKDKIGPLKSGGHDKYKKNKGEDK